MDRASAVPVMNFASKLYYRGETNKQNQGKILSKEIT